MQTDNLRALVTGGANGIGRAIVEGISVRGGSVVFTDIDDEAGEALEFSLSGNALFVHADASSEKDTMRAVSSAVERLGRINLVVANAGFMIRKPMRELSLDEWNRVIGTNLTGAFLVGKHAAPHMQKGGSMVLISSTRSRMSEPHTESYAASKGGISALTHALAVSLGPDVRVNAISPGWIDVSPLQHAGTPEALRPVDHEQHPAGRVGAPDDIVRAVLFLADPANSFITGTNLVVDGGMTVKMIYEE